MNQVETKEESLDGQMSFLEHFDEFRKRLVRSLLFVGVAFCICFYFSEPIYRFLSKPIIKALSEAQRQEVTSKDEQNDDEKIVQIKEAKEGDKGRYVFGKPANIGGISISAGTSVTAVVKKDSDNNIALYSDEAIFTRKALIPKGIRLPVDLEINDLVTHSSEERMTVTKTAEGFTLYLTVSLYAAIAFSIPFLLIQLWGFISPALYSREKKYVTPFVILSTVSFVIGTAFAYYILFPPAVSFLLGVSSDFQLLLNATDYLDFILIIMLAMGIIFQMPAVAYVLAKIGIISAGLLIRSWKIAFVVMLIVAAFVSPTGDVINLLLFATPMFVLYIVSIFVAWFFGKKRDLDYIDKE